MNIFNLHQEISSQLSLYLQLSGKTINKTTITINNHTDLVDAARILPAAQTVLFPADLALDLGDALQTYQGCFALRLPFPELLIQFDQPIPASLISPVANDDIDYLAGIILSQDDSQQNHAIAFFNSSYFCAVHWQNENDAPAQSNPLLTDNKIAAEHVIIEATTTAEVRAPLQDQLRLLVCAICAYLNCENIALDLNRPDAKISKKRAKHGKKPLPTYYTCRITKEYGLPAAKPERSDIAPQIADPTAPKRHVSFNFPVRGHIRRYQSGRAIWLGKHRRGLAHPIDPQREKLYRVARNRATQTSLPYKSARLLTISTN